MKTKIIPFDADMAKDIQDGKIKCKIKTRDGQDVCIVLWNKKDEEGYIILALVDKPATDFVATYTRNGELSIGCESGIDLVLEVPDNEPQFKQFDKVLVRDSDNEEWRISLYGGHGNDGFYVLHGNYYRQCIQYDGNQELVGTTDKQKEE